MNIEIHRDSQTDKAHEYTPVDDYGDDVRLVDLYALALAGTALKMCDGPKFQLPARVVASVAYDLAAAMFEESGARDAMGQVCEGQGSDSK